jgi:hypothetical protein
MANTVAIHLERIVGGWSVRLTDGRLIARFWGPGARDRALRYVHNQLSIKQIQAPAIRA